MSGVGSSELIILILIGLIVLGPKRLPQIANQLGSWIGQARRMTRAMRRQLEDEINFDDDGNFKSKANKIAPPFAADAPDPADPSYDDDDVEAHMPNDDDNYSPLHDDAGDDDEGDHEDEDDAEKNA